jgi:hypothetical protein
MPPEERCAAERRCEPEVAGVGPEACLGERQECSEREQAHAEEEPRAVTVPAERLDRDRLLAPLARDDEPRCDVQQHAGAASQRKRGERDAVDQRVDVEIAAEPRADAAQPAAVVGADEAPRRRLVEGGGVSGRVGHGEPLGR